MNDPGIMIFKTFDIDLYKYRMLMVQKDSGNSTQAERGIDDIWDFIGLSEVLDKMYDLLYYSARFYALNGNPLLKS